MPQNLINDLNNLLVSFEMLIEHDENRMNWIEARLDSIGLEEIEKCSSDIQLMRVCFSDFEFELLTRGHEIDDDDDGGGDSTIEQMLSLVRSVRVQLLKMLKKWKEIVLCVKQEREFEEFLELARLTQVKKRQLRAQFLLDSYKVKYETIDITDPALEAERDKMLTEAKRRVETTPPQPPQFFNDDNYCGDYEDMEIANDSDELFKFLMLEEDVTIENGNGMLDENDLFQPDQQSDEKKKPENQINGEQENDGKIDDDGESEEKVDTEVREQVTINGVAYDVPPNRQITIGGRTINVDELLAQQGDVVDLDEVDESLKEGLISSDTVQEDSEKNDQKKDGNAEKESEEEEDDEEEE